MSIFEIANENESMLTDVVAVASNEKQQKIQRYFVPVTSDVQMTLEGSVTVYAVSEQEAIEKVQIMIEHNLLNDLELQDVDEIISVKYGDLRCFACTIFEVCSDAVAVDDDDEVTDMDVLLADVKELRARISWDASALRKQKVLLESLVEPQSAAA